MRNRCFFSSLIMLSMLILVGCATSQGTPVTEAPIQQPAVSGPVAEQVSTTSTAEETPKISEELSALRQSIAKNDVEAIETLAHQIIDKNANLSESIEAHLALARRAMDQSKWDEALLYANSALDKDDKNLDTLLVCARILHAQNKDSEAVDKLNRAIDIHPKAAAPKALKSAILLGFLDVDRALETAKSAYELAPKDCDVILVYADALYAHHDFADAVSQYEKADAQKCRLSELSIQYLAKLYEVHVQDAQKACMAYSRLVDISPDNPYYKASRDYQCSTSGQ